MPTTTVNPERLVLEPHLYDVDIPLLATQASIEMDNARLGRPVEFKALRRLLNQLNGYMHQEGVTAGVMNPTYRFIIDRDTPETVCGSEKMDLPQLIKDAWAFVSESKNGGSGKANQKDMLAGMRDFCVELSKRASAHRQTLAETQPVHPHRR